jgi:hypothetical protein
MRWFAVPVVLIVLLAGCSGGAVEATIYGDGDVNCPDHWAQDESLPVGTVTFRPTDAGVDVEIVLTDAAPNWTYSVEVLPEDFCVSEEVLLASDVELVTDEDGAGQIRFAVTGLTPGTTYRLLVNVVSEPSTEVPEDPRLREMAPAGLTEVAIP